MRRFLGSAVMAALCGFLAVGVASACEIYDAIHFQTDFGFQLAGKTYPPGNYFIERTDLQYGQPLRIVKEGMNVGEDFNTEDIDADPEKLPDSDHVVFSVVDGKHVLDEIWLDSKQVGCKVVQEQDTKGEKKKVKGSRKKHSSEND
jgi:hypothetical protein